MIRFEHEGNSLQFSVPASYPYGKKWELVQTIERTASGKPYIETYPVSTGFLDISFKDLPDSDYFALVDWFLGEVNGMEKVFTLIDDLDVFYNVRFSEPSLDFSLSNFNLWEGTFTLEIQNA